MGFISDIIIIIIIIITITLQNMSYRNLVLQCLLTHETFLLRLSHADVAHLLHILAFHRRLGLHLLQLVLEMSNHLPSLLKLRLPVTFHLRDLLLQLTYSLPTFLLSVDSKTETRHATILLRIAVFSGKLLKINNYQQMMMVLVCWWCSC